MGMGNGDGSSGAGMAAPPVPSMGGPQHGGQFSNTEKVAHVDDAWKQQGKGNPDMIHGSRRTTPGEEQYIEIKAPSTVGNRSAVPYVTVLPSYKKKAESALNRQQIPKEHEKRVKEYFESLGGGK